MHKNKHAKARIVEFSATWKQRLLEHDFKSKNKGKFTPADSAGKKSKHSIIIKRHAPIRKQWRTKKRSVKVKLPLGASKKSAGPNGDDQSQMSDKSSYSCCRVSKVYESEDGSARGAEAKTNASAIDKFVSQNGATVTRQVYDAQSGDWIVLKKSVTRGKLE